MITKYIVNNDKIDFYEDNDIICSLPNTEDNLKLAKLYNDQVFIQDDIENLSKVSDLFNDYCKKMAINSLFCFIALLLASLINIPFVNLLFSFFLGWNIIGFVVGKDKLRQNNHSLSSLNIIKENIEKQIEEIQKSKNMKKVDEIQLTFSNQQIVENHQTWLKECGFSYDYAHDLDLIRNSKVFIKK